MEFSHFIPIFVSCAFSCAASKPFSTFNIFPADHVSISARIAGGFDAEDWEAPFMCSLQTWSLVHYCGCAVISDEWVITAANCLKDG